MSTLAEKTKISVVMPIYNAAKYLGESLDCIINQTFSNIEIICVDDGSTDNSPQILKEYAQKDLRIKVLHQENKGAGAARNLGFSHATGEYTFFFDSDDRCTPKLLEVTVNIAKEKQADIVAFSYCSFYEDGSKKKRSGLHVNGLSMNGKDVFSYKDCPNNILSIIAPVPWNKLYNTEFIRKNSLKFDEIFSTNDITFSALSTACAERIAFIKKRFVQYRVGHSGTITLTKNVKLLNVITAVESTIRQCSQLPHFNIIKKAVLRFAIDNYTHAAENNIKDFGSPVTKKYYDYLHKYFRSEDINNWPLRDIFPHKSWRTFLLIREYDYETMRDLKSRRLLFFLHSRRLFFRDGFRIIWHLFC